jgi:glycosyltransferase involved in cell wall biosynthesis
MNVERPLTPYFVSGCNVGTTFEYRVLHKQEQLALYDIQSVARQYLPHREVTLEESLSHDLLYLYRGPYDSFIEELIERARARGIPVVFGADDLVFEPELVHWVDSLKTMSHEEVALHYEGVWRYRQTLLACDAVVTSTQYLAELARALGKPTFVHRNALSGALIQIVEPLYAERQARLPTSDAQLTIGYSSGTATHDQDFLEISPALAQILARHPEVKLHIQGPLVVPSELKRFGERVRILPLVHWTEVPRILNTFDINLGPLERENPFCRGKSEAKYIEAAILGIPTVASRIDAFEFAICDGENGFLAGDTDEWVEKLERLLADSALRRRMGEAARADALARYTPMVRGHELRQTFKTIQELYAQQPASAPDSQKKPLVLNWVFTEPVPGSGGHADIIRMMNLLARLGHQINIYTVPYGRLSNKSDLEIRDFVRRHFANLEGNLFKWTGGPMADSDAVILTYWKTAYMLDEQLNTSKIFYFVQDWEPFFYPMGTQHLRAEQTYKMGFSCITLGPWLTEHLRSRYDADADFFDLAVDHSIYYPRPVDRSDRPRVCFYARPSTPRRLFPIGIEAFHRIHQRHPDAEIVFYGADDAALRPHTIPFPYTNRGILSEDELAELFSSSDVGVVLSSTNCSLVPPEMMACKCAVVDLNRETVRGVLEHDVNALLAEPTPEAIADAVARLLEDEPLRQRLVETAYEKMQNRSWEKSARKVEAILYEKLPASQRALDRRSPVPQSRPPALADLPSVQQEHLNAIHSARRQMNAQGLARVKGWVKRLLRASQGMLLNHKPVQTAGELTGHRCIGQSFVARRDNLHRVDVLIGAYGRRNTRDVILHLKESPTATQDLATARVNTSLLADNSYASFVFGPQPESRDKTYYFSVESPESAPGDAVTLWAYSHVDPPDARLYRNGRSSDGQLIFGLFYLDDQFGEVGERPLLHGWSRPISHWDRLEKVYRLLSSQGLWGLWREVVNYWKWKTGKM